MVNDQHDLLLPIANVGRIMKQNLPPSAKISKEAKETMQECVSEFISFVTGEASDKCQKENRKTVNGDDICWALNALGFDEYAVAIASYLHKYRDFEREKCNQSKAGSIEDSSNEEASHSCNSGSKPRKEADDETTPAPLEFELIKRGESSTTKH